MPKPLPGVKKVREGGRMEEKTPQILVIDDDEDIRQMLKNVLERHGFPVVTACDGQEGLEKVTKSSIRIVLCDIVMPKLDGLEFLKKVHGYNLSVEIIMITGKSNLDTCLESIERGACAYLIKPVQVDEILEAIERAQRNIREKQEMIRKILKKGS